MIVSWGGLLDSMAARCVEYDEAGVGTEIRQLRSLAKYADAGAFKPIRRGEESAPIRKFACANTSVLLMLLPREGLSKSG